MAFIGINYIGHFALRFAQRRHHRIRVRDRHPRIVLALPNQERRADFIDVIKRETSTVEFFVVIEIAAAPPPAHA